MAGLNVFYAHRKDENGAAAGAAALQDWMRKRTGADYIVTTGFNDWKDHFKGAGGWDGWAESVARRYAIIVLVDTSIGMATYKIVEHAVAMNKPVLLWTKPQPGAPTPPDGESISPATEPRLVKARIGTVNPDDWINAATVEVA